MNCPECRTPVDFTRLSCPRCKVLYLEAFEARAWTQFRNAAKKRRKQRLPKQAFALLAALSLACALAFGYLLLPAPAGLAPVPQALESAQGFSVAVPAGWTADFSELARGDRVSAARLSDGTTTVEVLVGPEALYRSARAGGGAAALAALEFNGDETKLDSVSELEVDRLPAVAVAVSGGRAYLPSPNAGKRLSELAQPAPRYESLEFGGELVVVPGASRSYLVKISSSKDELARRKRALEGLLGSMRIARRPRLAAL